jgi:hypothetical protein
MWAGGRSGANPATSFRLAFIEIDQSYLTRHYVFPDLPDDCVIEATASWCLASTKYLRSRTLGTGERIDSFGRPPTFGALDFCLFLIVITENIDFMTADLTLVFVNWHFLSPYPPLYLSINGWGFYL